MGINEMNMKETERQLRGQGDDMEGEVRASATNRSHRYQQLTDRIMKQYEVLTASDLLFVILKEEEESKQALYYLLNVKLQKELNSAFNNVFFSDGQGTHTFKTFEDYVSDFYLYLYNNHPISATPCNYYYLKKIEDPSKIKAWISRAFRNFLLEEQAILKRLEESLEVYRKDLLRDPAPGRGITMAHMAFGIAQFFQNESALDRYVFFRQAFQEYSNFYRWPAGELQDEEIAAIVGLSYAYYRKLKSRLGGKVRDEIRNITNAKIATLDKKALDIADRIYNAGYDVDELKQILQELLEECEKELPQYSEIVRAREIRKEQRSRHIPLYLSDTLSPGYSVISVFEKLIGWHKL